MEKLNQLKEQIRQELDLCDTTDTPTVCKMKQTEEGYAMIEKLVIDKVLYGTGMTISDAIVEIENEYDINSLD